MASRCGTKVLKFITLPHLCRGCHLITSKVLKEIEHDLSKFKSGVAVLSLESCTRLHDPCSSSLAINQNYVADLRKDPELVLNRVVPEGSSALWKNTKLEGPGRIKASNTGIGLVIQIVDGKLKLRTWQGIWLCEYRDKPTPHEIVATLHGI